MNFNRRFELIKWEFDWNTQITRCLVFDRRDTLPVLIDSANEWNPHEQGLLQKAFMSPFPATGHHIASMKS
ncbi:hypothetical protein NXC24_PB00201 (plasmid) [Rhizobium sp. NXC24]|nr:hypothetical protein NXC24_PB00201 [Rhizobium sp. NXC24]